MALGSLVVSSSFRMSRTAMGNSGDCCSDDACGAESSEECDCDRVCDVMWRCCARGGQRGPAVVRMPRAAPPGEAS